LHLIAVLSCSATGLRTRAEERNERWPSRWSTLSGDAAVPSAPRTGGTLRVGIVGGTNDLVDGQHVAAKSDIARLVTGWESLANNDDEFNVRFDQGLAEEVESKSADLYVIRIRDGVEFNNGKTLSADDVVYSFQRAIDAWL
jgi:peptide/nickel transport system substrate-binding protein